MRQQGGGFNFFLPVPVPRDTNTHSVEGPSRAPTDGGVGPVDTSRHPNVTKARAVLVETGWEALRVPLHDADGAVAARSATRSAGELAPMAPRLEELLDASPRLAETNGGLTAAQRRAKESLGE